MSRAALVSACFLLGILLATCSTIALFFTSYLKVIVQTQGIATGISPCRDVSRERVAAPERWQVGVGMLSRGKCVPLLLLPCFGLPEVLKPVLQ